ncbi:MAG: hypothetical protein LDL33_07600 [Desulfomonile sp.]|nr:hypothetical protein [Desulfomonile sp.]
MKSVIPKILMISILAVMTIAAIGGCFYGWFLPEPLKKPVSLRDGSARARGGMYFVGRTHYGGGFGAGK